MLTIIHPFFGLNHPKVLASHFSVNIFLLERNSSALNSSFLTTSKMSALTSWIFAFLATQIAFRKLTKMTVASFLPIIEPKSFSSLHKHYEITFSIELQCPSFHLKPHILAKATALVKEQAKKICKVVSLEASQREQPLPQMKPSPNNLLCGENIRK